MHTGLRLVQKLVISNDLEPRSSRFWASFHLKRWLSESTSLRDTNWSYSVCDRNVA